MFDKNGAAGGQSRQGSRSGGVLLVESASARPLVQAILQDAGYAVTCEANEPGQATLLARSLRPDVVLLHAALFPIPAFNLTRTLASERIAPVVWFADAAGVPDLSVTARDAGAMGLLSLPLRASDVGAMLLLAQTRFWELAQLEAEVKDLTERMEARKLVGRAKALLMERFRLSERDAFRRIQAQSAALNKPVHEVARAIITASEITAQ